MKFAKDRPYANPEAAARKLIEIANSVEAVVHRGRRGAVRLKQPPTEAALLRSRKNKDYDQRYRRQA